MKTRGIFITGTDTGIGKTHVAVRLMHRLRSEGLSVIGLKPVASGSFRQSQRWVNEDALALQAASSVAIDYEWVNPYALELPVSPHIAAEQMGLTVALPRLGDVLTRSKALADVVVVEGVGGWRVPLNASQEVADLALELGLPVVVVVGLRLGCINHALLTHESILASKVAYAGWIANLIAPDLLQRDAVMATLSRKLNGAPLATLDFEESEGLPGSPTDSWNMQEILKLIGP